MLCPVVCFNCGYPLDVYYKAFKRIREEEIKKLVKDGVKPNMVPMSDDLQPVLGKYLKDLGLGSECCSMNILTAVEISALEN